MQANEASLNAAQQKLIAELKKQALELSAKHKDDLQSNLSAQKNYYQGKLQEVLSAFLLFSCAHVYVMLC